MPRRVFIVEFLVEFSCKSSRTYNEIADIALLYHYRYKAQSYCNYIVNVKVFSAELLASFSKYYFLMVYKVENFLQLWPLSGWIIL